LGVALYFGAFYGFQINSLWATIIALLLPTFIIWWQRKDLVLPSLFTGFLLVIVAMMVYTVTNYITPQWVQEFWYFKNVPPIIILNLPIDDVIWYFVAGVFLGPLYEYFNEAKLTRISSKKLT
jgi:hypothetical protein